MARSIFRQPFMGSPKARVAFKVKPITLAVYSWEIPRHRLEEVLISKVPPGYVGTYPIVVKCFDGEWNIGGNGSIHFIPLGQSPRLV